MGDQLQAEPLISALVGAGAETLPPKLTAQPRPRTRRAVLQSCSNSRPQGRIDYYGAASLGSAVLFVGAARGQLFSAHVGRAVVSRSTYRWAKNAFRYMGLSSDLLQPDWASCLRMVLGPCYGPGIRPDRSHERSRMNRRLHAAILGGITALAVAAPFATAYADSTAARGESATSEGPSPWLAAPAPSGQSTSATDGDAALMSTISSVQAPTATDPGAALMGTVGTVPRLFASLHG